ncbi:MAG: hypothetical protein V2I46_07440 [Bacteroides sp.]|jgi:hypothetical protein|nr:hypothetical protein [Bacteroides sp.]
MGGLRRYILYLVGFTILTFLLTALFQWLAPAYMVSRVLFLIPLFYFLVLLVSQVILYRVASESDKKFTQTFMSITVARFLLYLAIVIVYSFLVRSDAIRFIISFFVYYFLFTVLEISYMYRELHPRKS